MDLAGSRILHLNVGRGQGSFQVVEYSSADAARTALCEQRQAGRDHSKAHQAS